VSFSEQDWLLAFAAELGVAPPSDEEREQLLALAGVAAHAAERTVAPISCWLAACSGVTTQAALEVARRLAGGNAA
jgi:C4-dicarboxylate transporter